MKRNWLLLGVGLVVLAALGRLVPHAANVTPLYAVALFACAVLPRRWAIAVPVTAMIVTDLFIGLHETILFTWSGMLVFAWLGFGLRGRTATLPVIASSLAGSVGFFLWTNFGVWLTMPLYPLTGAGLAQCYIAALPFFRNAVLGNIAFAGALFAAYQWYLVRRASRKPAPAAV
jgi:hypothetical protein